MPAAGQGLGMCGVGYDIEKLRINQPSKEEGSKKKRCREIEPAVLCETES
jgi:hypothetical protein